MTLQGRSRILFAVLFVAYAYFHQGGGWNQNSRFSQVRAVAETGTLSINDYVAYRVRGDAADRFERLDLPNDLSDASVLPKLNGYDIALYGGRLYPNKPPGMTLLALPSYFVLSRLEGFFGFDLDAWFWLSVNAFLVTVLTSGLLGAAAGVAAYRVSRLLHPAVEARWHAAAALALGLGTLFFPYATMLFDHAAASACLLVGFGATTAACRGEVEPSRQRRLLAVAGFVLGIGVLVNYLLVLAVVLVGLYALLRLRRRAVVLGWFVLGGGVPALVHFGYHQAAFGSPWTIANRYQHWSFVESGEHFLGVFGVPDPVLALRLVLDPHRGLLTTSPVLLLAVCGIWSAWRERRGRLEVGLVLAISGLFVLIVSSFNAWHGGNGYGIRYLVPVAALLGLYLAPALARWPRAGSSLAVGSVLLVLAVTATDPQIPSDVERPLLDEVLPALQESEPVSRNPTGVYEAFAYSRYQQGSPPVRWNSFNLGELVFPGSLWSLLPLCMILVWGGRRLLRRSPAGAGNP